MFWSVSQIDFKIREISYNSLINNRERSSVSKIRRQKKNQIKNVASTPKVIATITYTEHEEFNRLCKENYKLLMENECLKNPGLSSSTSGAKK